MKRTLTSLLTLVTLLTLAALPVACSDAEDLSLQAQEDEVWDGQGVRVSLGVNANATLGTRTVLRDSSYLQHVREVYLLIMEGHGPDALCQAVEHVNWRYKATQAGLPTREQHYTVRWQGFQPNQDYTLLAIGLDDRSGHTYNLPDDIEPGATTTGTALATLCEVRRTETYPTGKTDAQGQPEMAERLVAKQLADSIALSELYGGKTEITTGPTAGGTARVDLYRREAGVVGWFKNVPEQIDGISVDGLRIELYKAQNRSVDLSARPAETLLVAGQKQAVYADYEMDPISGVEDIMESRVIARLPLTAAQIGQGKPTLTLGGFVLPMRQPYATAEPLARHESPDVFVKDYTLRVVLTHDVTPAATADNPNPAKEQLRLRAKRLKLNLADRRTQAHLGYGEDAYRFALRANWFYMIGSPEQPIDLSETTGDVDILLEVEPGFEERHTYFPRP